MLYCDIKTVIQLSIHIIALAFKQILILILAGYWFMGEQAQIKYILLRRNIFS
jgi:hypothetical protein